MPCLNHFMLGEGQKFGGKIKLNRMKFVLFMILGTYTLSMDWVAS